MKKNVPFLNILFIFHCPFFAWFFSPPWPAHGWMIRSCGSWIPPWEDHLSTIMKYPLSWNMSDKSGKTRMCTLVLYIYIYLLEMETWMNPSNIFKYVIFVAVFSLFSHRWTVFSGHFSKDGYYHLPGRSALALQVYRMVLPCFGTSAGGSGGSPKRMGKWWKTGMCKNRIVDRAL